MQSIGERLEEARKRKGISIREAAEATKIRGDYLHKFESNQYDIRLPEIYVRGFLRSYSNFLRVPADKIIADYNALHHGVEPKSGRSVNREVYGRMEISTSKEKEPAPTQSGGSTTQPAAPATAQSGGDAGGRNPATFVPPHSTGSPLDKKLIIKMAAIAAALIVAIVLIVMLASGGTKPKAPPAPQEIWVQAQPNEPVITIAAKTLPVEVKVTSIPAQGTVTTYYQGTIPAGQSRALPRREALRVESANYTGVQFTIDGRPWDMTAAKVDIRAP